MSSFDHPMLRQYESHCAHVSSALLVGFTFVPSFLPAVLSDTALYLFEEIPVRRRGRHGEHPAIRQLELDVPLAGEANLAAGILPPKLANDLLCAGHHRASCNSNFSIVQ